MAPGAQDPPGPPILDDEAAFTVMHPVDPGLLPKDQDLPF